MPSAFWHLFKWCFYSLQRLFFSLHYSSSCRWSLASCRKHLSPPPPLISTLNGHSPTFIASSARRGNRTKCVCKYQTQLRVWVQGAGVEVSDLPCLSSQARQPAQVFPQHPSSRTLMSTLLFSSWRWDFSSNRGGGGGGWKYCWLCCLPPIITEHNFYI